MVHQAVVSLALLALLGQPVHHVQMPGETTGLADAPNRGEAAEVHADAYGRSSLLGRRYHLLDLVRVANVAWVQAQAVHPASKALQGEPIVEMDVGYQGDIDLGLDARNRLRRFHVGDGGADDVTARLFQTTYLRNSGVHIPCVSLGHRLHGDGRAAPDLYPSYHQWLGRASARHV